MVGVSGPNTGGDDQGLAGLYDELTQKIFVDKAGLSAADAERVAPFLQSLIKASKEEATRAAIVAAAAEKESKKNRKAARKSRPVVEETLAPRAREKKLRKEARADERARLAEKTRKEAERAQRPELALNSRGAPLPKSYNFFRSQFKQVIRANLGPFDYWGKKKEIERKRIRDQVKERFKNGADLDDKFLNKRIFASLSDMRNHQRIKLRKYLAQRPIDAEVVRKEGCPDMISPDEWAAWLEEELSIRA